MFCKMQVSDLDPSSKKIESLRKLRLQIRIRNTAKSVKKKSFPVLSVIPMSLKESLPVYSEREKMNLPYLSYFTPRARAGAQWRARSRQKTDPLRNNDF